MHRKTFRAIILIMLALVAVAACERGEKYTAGANSMQQQVALPAGKAAPITSIALRRAACFLIS